MSLNLLIVDDSITVRKVIAKALHMAGVDVGELIEAENGQEALRVLERQEVDLVLSDVSMPFMDGEALVKEMETRGLMQKVPVVMISSAGSQPRVERLRQLGVKDFLSKPFTPEEIGDVVARYAKGGVA